MTQFVDAQGEYREKREGSIADFGLNWAPFLGSDTIQTVGGSSWEVPAGITEESSPAPSNTATTTSIWLSGGTAGQEYVLINTIQTVGGRTWVRPLRIKVVALLPEVADLPGFTYNELSALRTAYAQGVLRVRYGVGSDQKEVEYPNGDELLKRIRHLEGELIPEVAATPRRRQIRMSTGKGF